MLNGLVTIPAHAFLMERQVQSLNVFGAIPAGEAGNGARPTGWAGALRRGALLAAIAVSAAIMAHGFLSTSDTEVRARLAIDRKGATETVVDAAFLEAQAKLIASRDALRRVATELGVTHVESLSKPPLGSRLLQALGVGGASKLVSPEERLTDALASRFSASPSGHGRAIDVRFLSDNTDFATRFVDRVVADYLLLQGTDGGVGARLVSGAMPVERPVRLSPTAGAALAGLSVLVLGGGAGLAFGLWRRRREASEFVEEAPLAVGALEPVEPRTADRVDQPTSDDALTLSPEADSLPGVPGVDLEGRRRVAVASFDDDGGNRRLVDEIARDGGFNGARIVVIDASRRTGDRPGLAELLAGEADFADVIQRNATSRAHEIGSGRRPLTALAEETDGAAMLLEALEQTYDLVLIDLGRLRTDPAFTLFARLAGQLILTGDAESGAVDTLLAALGRRGVTGIVRMAAPASSIAA